MQAPIEKFWMIPNLLDDLTDISRLVFDWLDHCDLSSRAKYAGRLAIEELVSNTIKYGYDDDEEHVITLHIVIDSEYLRMDFADDGHEFDPTAQKHIEVEDIIETVAVGGLGIELLQRICAKMEYRRDREKNVNYLSLLIRKREPDDTQNLVLDVPIP